MDGRNSARRYPSIEVEPADSELHKRTARLGCRVRQSGLRGTQRHHATFPTKTRRNVSADESIQVCNIGTGGEEQEKNEVECTLEP
jgi:hypothetical protein